jgi:N6-adenosine-specific RNA methylase IME4
VSVHEVAPFVSEAALTIAVDGYRQRIAESYRQTVEGFFEIGRILLEAKRSLPHGAFGEMIRNALPFGDRHARRFMEIASDPRLSNRTTMSVLPAAFDALHCLTKLDDESFERLKVDGTISPNMRAGDIATAAKQQVRSAKERALGNTILALPDRLFGLVVTDDETHLAPWSAATGMDRSASNHYATSPFETLAARQLPAADHSINAAWATVPLLPQALAIMAARGFEYRSHIVWEKDRVGTGYWFRNKHEILLIGVRGKPPGPAPGTQWPSLIRAPVGRHSAKPEIFLELLEEYYPTLPKIEFNRRGPARRGWEVYGDEAIAVADSPEYENPPIDLPQFLDPRSATV